MTPVASQGLADPHEARRIARLADDLGFAALWARDVPLMVPQGPDAVASALDDPFLWLGMLAAATERIVIGSAAIVLPLRQPLQVAKSALSLTGSATDASCWGWVRVIARKNSLRSARGSGGQGGDVP